jgi:hypothetical protein
MDVGGVECCSSGPGVLSLITRSAVAIFQDVFPEKAAHFEYHGIYVQHGVQIRLRRERDS